MADGQLQDLARKFRAQILAQERAAANQLVRRYGQAWRALSARAADTAAKLAEDIALGGTPTPAHLYQHRRVLAMRSLVEQEIGQFARFADLAVQASQSEAVEAARTHAAELLGAALEESAPGLTAGFEAVSTEALSDLVGFLSDGTPLARLFAQLGPEAGATASQALVDGLVRGLGPRDVARHMRDALGGNMTRALTISRTEMLRSYRESSQRSYRANSDVVQGWVWTSTLGGRTCSACWSEHGSVHPLDETMSSHPRCRCSPVPQTKTWSDLGFTGLEETRYEPRRGADLFAELDETAQRAVLGPGKFAAYRDGKIELGDLVEHRQSARWGTTTGESSLRRALARAEGRPGRTRSVDVQPGPVGVPVSQALRVDALGDDVGEEVRHALAQIDKVHGDGDLPSLSVTPLDSARSSKHGDYRFDSDEAVGIRISSASDQQGLTLAHEVGHFLDHQTIGEVGRFGSFSGATSQPIVPGLADWRAAIDKSKATAELRGLSGAPKYQKYLLDNKEQWARSYAQWIAVRSGDTRLLNQLASMRTRKGTEHYVAHQWDDDDFEPIAAAFDRIFAELGWRRP